MPAYKFGALMGVFEIDAPSDLIAHAAMMVLLDTSLPIAIYEPADQPMLAINTDPDPRAAAAKHFGTDFDDFMEKNFDAVQAAVASAKQSGLHAPAVTPPAP